MYINYRVVAILLVSAFMVNIQCVNSRNLYSWQCIIQSMIMYKHKINVAITEYYTPIELARLSHFTQGMYVQSLQRFCAASSSKVELCKAELCTVSLQSP